MLLGGEVSLGAIYSDDYGYNSNNHEREPETEEVRKYGEDNEANA